MTDTNTTPINDETEQLTQKSALTMLGVALSLAAGPLILLILLAKSMAGSNPGTDDPMNPENIAQRLQPVGGFVLVPKPKGPQTGQQVYESLCTSCHATGTSGAPKVGSADWAPRIGKGFDTLFKHATEGFNQMPARGGNPNLSDLEIKRSIVYMANKSGGSFEEPKDETATDSTSAAQ
jgi:cytochrome c5